MLVKAKALPLWKFFAFAMLLLGLARSEDSYDPPSEEVMAKIKSYAQEQLSPLSPPQMHVQSTSQTLSYDFFLLAAFVFPADFTPDLDRVTAQLRGATRLTQLFYRRLMASLYPESYLSTTNVNNNPAEVLPRDDPDNDPIILVLLFEATFEFRLVGNVPTLAEITLAATANNEPFLPGCSTLTDPDAPCDNNPEGFSPADYTAYVRATEPLNFGQPTNIFSNVTFATIYSVDSFPTIAPSDVPTTKSNAPSTLPSNDPSRAPSTTPSSQPSVMPMQPTTSLMPTTTQTPSQSPSVKSMMPSSTPSETPSVDPSSIPSTMPSSTPSARPSGTTFNVFLSNSNIPAADFDNNIVPGIERIASIVAQTDLSSQPTDGNIFGRCPIPAIVDDLAICAFYDDSLAGNPTDPDRILGQAFPRTIRGPNDPNPFLPITGWFSLNPDIADNLPLVSYITQHEVLHVFGIGSLWGSLRGFGTTFDLVLNDGESDCQYRADTKAAEQFHLISGCPSTKTIPLQPIVCGHWNEDCFGGRVLMDPGVKTNIDEPDPLTFITIGSLEDLGYTVDYTKGDVITDADFSQECSCGSSATAGENFEKKPALSEEGRAIATAYGLKTLREERDRYQSLGGDEALSNDQIFIGDKGVYVFYLENDQVHDVLVTL